jgi:hypothetical protein
MRIGSDEHKELFCRDFIASHNPYVPERLPWPELDARALARLRSVPFWQEVYYAERRAGALVQEFAKTIDDPLLREAIDLQGFEEARHSTLISVMIQRYGLEATDQPIEELPANIETAFMDFGYGECVDAFFGFGVCKVAKRANFLPDSLFSILEMLLHEETRHIVFFVNWMGYRETRRGPVAAALRGATSALFHARAVGRHLASIRKGDHAGGANFSATQAEVFPDGFSIRDLIEQCLVENARRMAEFDPRLLRPRLMPALTRVAYSAMKLYPQKRELRPKAA